MAPFMKRARRYLPRKRTKINSFMIAGRNRMLLTTQSLQKKDSLVTV
jgi:hypothetical protein